MFSGASGYPPTGPRCRRISDAPAASDRAEDHRDDLNRWALPTLPSADTLELAAVKAESAQLRERLDEVRDGRETGVSLPAMVAAVRFPISHSAAAR